MEAEQVLKRMDFRVCNVGLECFLSSLCFFTPPELTCYIKGEGRGEPFSRLVNIRCCLFAKNGIDKE